MSCWPICSLVKRPHQGSTSAEPHSGCRSTQCRRAPFRMRQLFFYYQLQTNIIYVLSSLVKFPSAVCCWSENLSPPNWSEKMSPPLAAGEARWHYLCMSRETVGLTREENRRALVLATAVPGGRTNKEIAQALGLSLVFGYLCA